MTRSYALDNWDGHLSKFDAHKLPHANPMSSTLETSGLPINTFTDLQRPILFSSNSNTSMDCSKSAVSESEVSFCLQTISATSTADAYGEEEEEDIIILEHIRTSFPIRNKPTDEACTTTLHDSLFTPPPSEAGALSSASNSPPPFNHRKKSWMRIAQPAPRKVMSHVLVPPLSRPKSDYIQISSLIKRARKRPRRTVQEGLKEALESAWQNNAYLDYGNTESEGRRKKRRKRKHNPIPESTMRSDEDSVVFVNRVAKVQHPVEATTAENAIIDLTLEDDLQPLPGAIQSDSQVTEPTSQIASEETRIRIGVIHTISYSTLLDNTRFLRCRKGDIVHMDPQKDVMVDSLLPFRRRRALLDVSEVSSLDGEFSLGSPTLTHFGPETTDSDYDDHSEDKVVELLNRTSETPIPKPISSPKAHPPSGKHEPLASLPKIDLAANFRKQKAATQRSSSALTPSARKRPLQPNMSHTSVSSLRNGHVPTAEDGYSPRTSLVPSAKALGKRKAVDLSPVQLRPDVQSSFSSVTIPESFPSSANVDHNFELYVNYSPSSPLRSVTNSANPSSFLGTGAGYAYPDIDPNLNLSNINFVDHHHDASPSFSSAEPSLFYHSDDYTSPTGFTNVLDDLQRPESIFLSTWSPVRENCYLYDNGTVNPSLLGGEMFGMPEHPESDSLEVGNEFESRATSNWSPPLSHSALSSTFSSSSKSEAPSSKEVDSKTIFLHEQSRTFVSDAPDHKQSRRRAAKRTIPDMVPISELQLSSDFEEASEDDDSVQSFKPRIAPSTPSKPSLQSPSSRPKVMVGGQLWPMQDEATYCHQCRNKTMVLKLECQQCPKTFCVRCLTLRYPNEPRALQMKEAGCPSCLEYCNCTNCCRKRGVEYVPTKHALAGGVVNRAEPSRISVQRNPRPSSSVPSSPSTSPAPTLISGPRLSSGFSTRLTPSGGVYWGVIYGADGSKIGTGFSFPNRNIKETTPAVSVQSVPEEEPNDQPKKKHVYLGIIHPSWQVNETVKNRVLDPVRPLKTLHGSQGPRKYVGNKKFLFNKSEMLARELALADLSPLSSLEEDWDEEEKEGSISGGLQDSKDGSVLSLKSLNDHDVMRAIGLGLHACGIQLAG